MTEYEASGPSAGSRGTGADQVLPWSVLRMATTCWPGSPSWPTPVVTVQSQAPSSVLMM